MASNANTDVDKLITFGQMALEQGWYDQAREYFEQALALDASNREAMKGLARANEILSRRRATPVEPTRAEPVKPPPKVSIEPAKPEVEPAKPKPGLKLATMWKGKGRWLILAVIPVALLAVVFAYPRIEPMLQPTPTPMPTPIATPATNEYCESLIQFQEAALSLEREWSAVFRKYSYTNSWELVGELREVYQRWANLKPPDVDAAWSWYLKVERAWRYQMDSQGAILNGEIVRSDYLLQLGNDTLVESGRFRDRVKAEVAKCKADMGRQ